MEMVVDASTGPGRSRVVRHRGLGQSKGSLVIDPSAANLGRVIPHRALGQGQSSQVLDPAANIGAAIPEGKVRKLHVPVASNPKDAEPWIGAPPLDRDSSGRPDNGQRLVNEQ